MVNKDLDVMIEASLEMLKNIKEKSPYNSDEVNNKALLNTSKFINNIVLNNNGKQLLLFNDK